MLELQLPARHEWASQDKTHGKLVIEPFEPGFALTVGIAYRRALLSAIHGAAPTWVKIENRSEEHTSELQSRFDLVCRLLLEKKKKQERTEGTTSEKLVRKVFLDDSGLGEGERVDGLLLAAGDVFLRVE